MIEFDVSSISSSATVVNAVMKMYYYQAVRVGSTPWVDRLIQAHQLLVDWDEVQATKVKRLTSTNWNADWGDISGGIDAKAAMESNALIKTGETGTWKSWNLTDVTQDWVDGSASNYGVILWATNEDTDGYDLRFYSSEYSSENLRPKLEVTYSTAQKTVYFLKDHLGSIRATVLDSATSPVVGYDDYDPWGYILADRSSATAWSGGQNVAKNKFTGKEWDDDYSLNWSFHGARYYDPEIGRWVVRDALAGLYPSHSPYNYALNNPVNLFDPNGLQVDSTQQQKKKEKKKSFLEIFSDFAKKVVISLLGRDPVNNLPPEVIDTQRATEKAAETVAGEGSVTEAVKTIVQNSQSGSSPPQPDPNRVVLQDILKNTKNVRKKRSGLLIYDKEGDFNTANNDFEQLKGVGSDKPLGNGKRLKILPDGRRVIVRPTSTEGGKPTLEFQNSSGKPIQKIRYSRN